MSAYRHEKKKDQNNCVTTTIATNIFDAVATLKTGVGFIPGIPLDISQAFDNLLNALNSFATNIAKDDCLPSQEWICFLQCILSSFYSIQASTPALVGIRAILERINLTIGLVPTSRENEKEKDCKDRSCVRVCYSISLVFAAILELIGAALTELATALGLSTPGGAAFIQLATNIYGLVRALRSSGACNPEKACKLFPCVLKQVLMELDLLFINFIQSNEVPVGNALVADVIRRIHSILVVIASDCLNNLTSKTVKIDPDLKAALCSLENTINSLIPLSLSPLATLVTVNPELNLLF